MTFDLFIADICLPDYWSGHHLPHVSIPIYGPMTLKEIKQSLHNEVSQGAIAGSVCPDEMPESWWKALHAAINRLSNQSGFRGKHFKNIPVDYDDDYTCFAFFVFTERE